MKRLYSFNVDREEMVDQETVTKNDKGEEVKTIVKVKKPVPQKFFLRKPTRMMYDDAELFYGVQFSVAIKEGLLTRAQLATKFSDEGGTLSRNEKKRYVDAYLKLAEKEQEYQKATLKEEAKRSPEEQAKVTALLAEVTEIRRELQDIETNQQSLFDYTAENRARNKTVLWWVFQLAYYDNEVPVFGSGDYTSKIARYDEFEEQEDPFMIGVVTKLLYLVSFWFIGRAEKPEDFEKLLSLAEKPVDQPVPEAPKETVKDTPKETKEAAKPAKTEPKT